MAQAFLEANADPLGNRYPIVQGAAFAAAKSEELGIALDGPAHERPGLFLVGDPKQSIYRFRRADIAIYEETKRLIEASGGELLVDDDPGHGVEVGKLRRGREPGEGGKGVHHLSQGGVAPGQRVCTVTVRTSRSGII